MTPEDSSGEKLGHKLRVGLGGTLALPIFTSGAKGAPALCCCITPAVTLVPWIIMIALFVGQGDNARWSGQTLSQASVSMSIRDVDREGTQSRLWNLDILRQMRHVGRVENKVGKRDAVSGDGCSFRC